MSEQPENPQAGTPPPKFGPPSPPRTQPRVYSIQSAADLITQRLDLDNVEGFSIKGFFSEVFGKHDPDEIETLFSVGSPVTTPSLHPRMANLPSPWLFFRVLLASVAVYLLFVMGWTEFRNPLLVPGLIMVGSFAVPGAVLVLFFEINTPKNVSIVRVMQLVLMGGVLSLLISLLLFEAFSLLLGIFGASAAGIVEEVGKLAAVLLALRFIRAERYPYLLNAMLFGAAVGTGFAAFESAGHALVVGLQDADAMLSNITMRGVLAPFGHIVWTAIAASAYWLARPQHPTVTATVTSRAFLVPFSAPVALHFVWNLPVAGPFYLKYLILGFIAWVIVASLFQSGLREVGAAAQRTGAAATDGSSATDSARGPATHPPASPGDDETS